MLDQNTQTPVTARRVALVFAHTLDIAEKAIETALHLAAHSDDDPEAVAELTASLEGVRGICANELRPWGETLEARGVI